MGITLVSTDLKGILRVMEQLLCFDCCAGCGVQDVIPSRVHDLHVNRQREYKVFEQR